MNATMYSNKFEVQIFPEGEELFHSFDFECECEPNIYVSDRGQSICHHNSWSSEELMDIAEHSIIHKVRQEIDC